MSGRQPFSGPLRLDAGIPAFNEESRIGTAIASLVHQTLPSGFEWGTIWVVASGCTDRTAAVARATDRRVVVLEEAGRRGKSDALTAIFDRTQADLLVLLDADDVATPGALALLLERARSATAPFAISGRPVLPSSYPTAGFPAAVRLLWEVHHRFQMRTVTDRTATTLTEELLVLPAHSLPPLTRGIINDGAFIVAWTRLRGGIIDYVEGAHVEILAPQTLSGLVTQRRRIRAGIAQTRRLTGLSPSSVQREFFYRPQLVLSLLRGAARDAGVPSVRSWLLLTLAESVATLGSLWDRIFGHTAHVRWVTIPEKSAH